MKNLFNSTEIATIFLDKEMNIRNFTPEASTLIKIRKSDVGRPIGDIATNIKYKYLESDIKQVLDRLIMKEEEIQTNDGNWYLMRIVPYRTSEDVIDGVVVTFVDINQRMIAEKKIKDALKYAESLINTIKEPVLVLDHDLKVFSSNKYSMKNSI
jgi:two-component system CheB/CheR fusion protein